MKHLLWKGKIVKFFPPVDYEEFEIDKCIGAFGELKTDLGFD